MIIFVIAEDGTKLMPTFNIKKVRNMLRTGLAIIHKHEPFTIKLTHKTTLHTQPIEFKEDAGYQTIGVSACSTKHEYISQERVLLKDEVAKHNDCRIHRRSRRTRLRYRVERRNNRKATNQLGWLAPSIENKKNQHVRLLEIYLEVMPITSAVIEVAQFDTQVLKAVQDGTPLPSGTDYQHGERYGYDTLREAVFARDGYNCIICKRNAIKDGVILRTHHLGYWKKDHTNRLSNLATVCLNCHTSKNHQLGGKLYGLNPSTKNMSSAAFMNAVKCKIVEQIKEDFPNLPVSVTFGAITKRTRNNRNIIKTHANDAYCMGKYHPKHRTRTERYQKRRRNNRVLEKFHDAKFVDIRDGSKKSGSDIGCNRASRREPRNSPKNERIFRGEQVSKGRRSIRRRRYELRPRDIVLYDRKKYKVIGVHSNGAYTNLEGLTKTIKTKLLTLISHVGGWIPVCP